MKFEDLKDLYDQKREQFGKDAYKHISDLLIEAKEIHKVDFFQRKPKGDHEQSWRSFKENNLEKLILYVIEDCVENIGLRSVLGKTFNKKRLSKDLSHVKRNLLVDFREYGSHLPDVDIAIYHPQTFEVIAIISSKVTLRERIAQTAYWKLKFLQDGVTENIKVYFVTLDEDHTLSHNDTTKKGRAIVESDLDCTYVMTRENIEESKKVKLFEHFFADLKKAMTKN